MGVDANLMTFRRPIKICMNDASEHGLGGFSVDGMAWSWTIPASLRGRAHASLLELVAQLTSVWTDADREAIGNLDCVLAMGDNTASMGWLRRSDFRENDEGDMEWIAKQTVATKAAEVVLESNSCLCRQWLRGKDNVAADSLPRDGRFLSNHAHEKILKLAVPTQAPEDFKTIEAPEEIFSFAALTLQLLPAQQQRCRAQKLSELALSSVGTLSCLASELKLSSCAVSQGSRSVPSCPPLPKLCEKRLSLQQLKDVWQKEQSMPPCHAWLRPSGQTIGLTPDWTRTERSVLSSKSSFEGIATKMGVERSKKRCRCKF